MVARLRAASWIAAVANSTKVARVDDDPRSRHFRSQLDGVEVEVLIRSGQPYFSLPAQPEPFEERDRGSVASRRDRNDPFQPQPPCVLDHRGRGSKA